MLSTSKEFTTNTNTEVYDVVIMGAGFAGLCQARHLLLKIPGIKVALIDPRSPERLAKDMKVGESTVEITAMFLFRELGLYEYLIEHHTPKYGLTFHWTKDNTQTKHLDDYHHIWVNGTPHIDSFHINRGKFERDLLKMNQDMGVTFYNGRVTEFNLSPQDEMHQVNVKLAGEKVTLQAKHLVDAAGRRFLIGKKTGSLMIDEGKLKGINTGASWLRVKNVNTQILHKTYEPELRGGSRYYTTHHVMGHGHWIWVIPITTDTKELSIGIVHHKSVISAKDINTLEKYKSFLKANHTLLYDLIESGEVVDFHYLPKVAHMSKEVISTDNWYIIGDAGYIFDPLYSIGLVFVSHGIECNTEAIRSKLAGEAEASKKQQMYNQLMFQYQALYLDVYQKHEKHLGHASAMSWRIYLECMLWFGVFIPIYLGKWFLDFEFIENFCKSTKYLVSEKYGILSIFYEEFDRLVEEDINVGLMDYTRGDQLFFGYCPAKATSIDNNLFNTKLEPLRLNIFKAIKSTHFYIALLYLKLRWKAYGVKGILSPLVWFRLIKMFEYISYLAMGELIYLFKTRNLSNNSVIEKMRKDFEDYRYQPQLQPWMSESDR
ncbi:MAG: tryptophan 7-halogenase [Oscillatoria sp. PMC 1068.18]|nr:tryptophan 7-halogenase [Oscillatoria sp. PMC 1076.18]MEC4987806.1 tryptophan 7-halogenase [Oscillatoria sp. PMC 1068.18]